MSSNNPALDKLFQRHRVVFWYDPTQEIRQAFDAYNHPQVRKCEVHNNEFGIKYRILQQEPDAQFLLYLPYAEPLPAHNWLLDIQLSNGVFQNDKVSLWLEELGLDNQWRDIIVQYDSFFAAKERRDRFKTHLTSTVTPHSIIFALLASCAKSHTNLSDIVLALINELYERTTQGDNEELHPRMRMLRQHNLDALLWRELALEYGYQSQTPTLLDFIYKILAFSYAESVRQHLNGTPYTPPLQMTDTARALVILWQDSNQYGASFRHFSTEVYQQLHNIRDHLEGLAIAGLCHIQLFRSTDFFIFQLLAQRIEQRSIRHAEVDKIVRQRLQSYWVLQESLFANLYAMLNHASALLEQVQTLQIRIDDIPHGIQSYTSEWHKVDYHYRHFVRHQSAIQMQLSDQLQPLLAQVDNAYTNTFLRPLNNAWQDAINQIRRWHVDGQLSQTDFYRQIVTPLVTRKKVAVIIVDGMRYEIGAELFDGIRHNYESQLQALLGVIPSYTQLGQAALLPHQQLSIEADANMSVKVDQRASAGVSNRRAILQQQLSASNALTMEEFKQLNRDQRRTLVQANELLYIYHDSIDKTGENQESQVCKVACETIEELKQHIKSLMDANISTVIITADHGFLYQQHVPSESEFMVFDNQHEGTTVFAQKRRMVIGRDLPEPPSLKHFTVAQLGLTGNCDVLIPYSINRLRLQGAQSRYVHGGATLQEVIVPVLVISKSNRVSGTTPVGFKITNNIQNRITTAQFVIEIYQEQPISTQIVARRLRIKLCAKDGTLIGSAQSSEIILNSPATNATDRSMHITIVLNEKAQKYNRQDVFLIIEEPIINTEQFNLNQQHTFQLNRMIVTDF